MKGYCLIELLIILLLVSVITIKYTGDHCNNAYMAQKNYQKWRTIRQQELEQLGLKN